MNDWATAESKTMYFVVGDRTSGVAGYAWRLGASGTSFYIKARYTPLSSVKISLHGPDPRPGLSDPGFKIGIDMQAELKATTVGGATRDFGNGRPTWFTGRQVRPGVTHVMTFRSTWDLFQTGIPMGPWPGDIRPGAVGLIVPVPDVLTAADVDIYVSDGKPFWRDEHQARRDNACLGPLRNKADQYLTGVSTRRSTLAKPTPTQALAPNPKPGDKRVRGIGTAVDDEGVLWVVEQVMSPSDLGQE